MRQQRKLVKIRSENNVENEAIHVTNENRNESEASKNKSENYMRKVK